MSIMPLLLRYFSITEEWRVVQWKMSITGEIQMMGICVQKETDISFDPEDIPRPLTPVLLRIACYLIVFLSLLVRHKGAAPNSYSIGPFAPSDTFRRYQK
jgi:hypothetical protein